jgi:hypothetical protein
MSKWKKSDIGKVIVFKRDNGLMDKVVIYNVDLKAPNTVGFMEYPISLDSEIHPPYISSKIGILGLVKDQEKKKEEYIEKSGDWCFLERVLKDEMRELERIARYPINLSDQD